MVGYERTRTRHSSTHGFSLSSKHPRPATVHRPPTSRIFTTPRSQSRPSQTPTTHTSVSLWRTPLSYTILLIDPCRGAIEMDAPDVMPAWSLLRGYFSPATLFLLLNVVIGTIALTSRSHRRRHNHHHDDDHHHQQHQKDYVDQYDAAPPAPAPLARTSSVMERLRSLGLYRFSSGDFPPEYNYSLSAGDDESGKHQQQAQYARSRSEPAAAKPPTNRTGNGDEKAAKAKVAKKPLSEVKRLERAPAPAPARLVQRAPRAPVARAVVTAAPEAAPAACVDERADDFINKFRQQLQLQRLNSLLNYKEMLNRGT
ncbi:hypothetical protein ACQ4PT_028575 [Festuca glaucescens]